jgi:5-methyltetrahydropteroyltriglutamate--homocysteine methyltransferase
LRRILEGVSNLAPDGVVIPFEDGHTRQLPRLTSGPFRYGVHAAAYLTAAKRLTSLPVKQAVISADIRGCFEQGADSVQIDFTEGRLSLKIDPAGGLRENFVQNFVR